MDEQNVDFDQVDHDSPDVLDIVPKPKTRKKRKKEKSANDLPSIQRAWKVGYCAAQANLPETRNPFMSDSCEFQAWLEGWWSGFYDEPLHVGIIAAG